jgi:neural Wiskott-Aldrich syndrome protein
MVHTYGQGQVLWRSLLGANILVKRALLSSERLLKRLLTRYFQEKEPEKKTTPRPSTLHPQYGGPGSFKPSNPGDVPASLRTGHGSAGSSPSGSNRLSLHERHNSTPASGLVPDSLRPSGSLAQLDLYVPPYETKTLDSLSASHVARPSNVSEFGVNEAARRRDSFPASFLSVSSKSIH